MGKEQESSLVGDALQVVSQAAGGKAFVKNKLEANADSGDIFFADIKGEHHLCLHRETGRCC